MAAGFSVPAGVPIIPSDEIVVGVRYASGASGYVCGAKLRNQPVVAKGFFALDNPELYGYEIGSVTHRWVVEEVLKEAQLLSSLNHKNIVKMHGIVLDPATRYPKYVVMERAYCTLRKYLKDKGRISAVEIERLCAGVLSAMDYLHAPKPDSQQFAHRDIKDDNILVFYDKEGFTVKLCDMDHAKAAGSDGRVSRSGGAPFYLAPEATDAANATVDVKMDVFSFGILVAEIVLNFLPNSDGSPLVPVDVAHVYGTAGRSQMIEAALLKLLPFPTLSLLLRGCVTVDPLSRFTACDALALLADPRPASKGSELVSGLTVAIDLGTTHACVATWIHDHSFVIPNEYGNLTTPSYVAFTNTGVLVGEAAKYQASVNPTNTVYDIKRLIGRKFSDPDVQADMKFWPFRVVRGPFDKPLIEVTFRHKLTRFAPEEISALMYHHMKKVAESFFRCAVQNAVITVPAPFDDSQRHATKDAAIISGLNVLRIVDESTAATLAAGWSDKEKISVVFDFGGGLANASLSVSEHGVVEVKSISGDDHLGGEDFDNRLVSHCVEDIKRRLHKDVTVSQVAIHRLRVACERAKRELSFQREATVEIDNLIDGISYSVTISRAQFERMCVDLFEKAVGIASTLLNSIRMPFPKHHVHQILLTGGCTRIPKVRQVLREYFDDRELSRTLNPDIAVAKGAALQVAQLAGLDRSGALDDFVLLDVVSYSLGLILPDGSLREMIPRSCLLPCKKLRLMTIPATFCSESSLVLRVAAGESRDCSGCWVLGEIGLDGLTPDTAGNWEIEVTFDVDSGNALVVTAAEKSSGRESEMTISNDAGRISTSELRKMMLTFSEIVEIDRSEAQRVSAKCRFENYLHAVDRVLFDEALSLTPAEVNACERVFHHAVVWLDSRFDGGCEVEFENKLVWLQSELPESVRCRVSCHGVASTAAHRRAVDLYEVD